MKCVSTEYRMAWGLPSFYFQEMRAAGEVIIFAYNTPGYTGFLNPGAGGIPHGTKIHFQATCIKSDRVCLI